jgi:hypothetical protein
MEAEHEQNRNRPQPIKKGQMRELARSSWWRRNLCLRFLRLLENLCAGHLHPKSSHPKARRTNQLELIIDLELEEVGSFHSLNQLARAIV